MSEGMIDAAEGGVANLVENPSNARRISRDRSESRRAWRRLLLACATQYSICTDKAMPKTHATSRRMSRFDTSQALMNEEKGFYAGGGS